VWRGQAADVLVLSTDLISARNASFVAVHGSTSGVMPVTIQRENIRPSKKEMTMTAQVLVRDQDVIS
jgi:hypothetical protein